MPENGNVCFSISCSWMSCLSRPIKPSIGEKLVAKREFNNTMDKHSVKVVKGNETVSQLPCKFSRIVWYFLAHSGEISVEVIGCRRCGRMEVPC